MNRVKSNLYTLYLCIPAGYSFSMQKMYNLRVKCVNTWYSVCTKIGRRVFSVASPTAWNLLPDYLCDPLQLVKTLLSDN